MTGMAFSRFIWPGGGVFFVRGTLGSRGEEEEEEEARGGSVYGNRGGGGAKGTRRRGKRVVKTVVHSFIHSDGDNKEEDGEGGIGSFTQAGDEIRSGSGSGQV